MKTLKISLLSVLIAGFFLAIQVHSETADTYEISQGELDQILAPIALYPDTVLSHILIASTYPLEVIQAERWTRENPTLEGDEALKAVENKDWDPSVKALVPFPQILKQMSENLDWMQKLGDAFLQNEEMVLASIQELRQRAYDEGSLDDFEHLKVSHEEDNIVIEPTVREVVYVPYYDTRVVYGSWWWVDYPPVYWVHHHHHYYPGSWVYWGPRVHVGYGFYFSGVHWHNHHVVVVDRHYARRHHFHSGRHVVHHRDSRKWIHNTRHRRGVEYRHPQLRQEHRAIVARSARNADAVSRRLQQNHSRSYDSDRDRDPARNYHRGERNDNDTRIALPGKRGENPAVSSRHSNENNRNESKWDRVQETQRSTPSRTTERVERPSEAHNRQVINNRHSMERKAIPTPPRSAPNRTYSTERSDSSRGTYRASDNNNRSSAVHNSRSTNSRSANDSASRSRSSRHERIQR